MASLSRNLVQGPLAVLLSLSLFVTTDRMAAQPAEPAVLNKVRDAIMRGMVYFGSQDQTVDEDVMIIHSYLKDRFGLPELCAERDILSRIKNDAAHSLHTLSRISDTIPFHKSFIEARGGSNDITICGIWYDQLPDKKILMDRIKAADLDQPYNVTHALWAMAIAQQCFQAKLDTAMERRLVALNKEIVAQNRPRWNDVAIEALVMAQYHDPSYIPPSEYIKEIISLQGPDGSWNIQPGDRAQASQHTTILALWALLQYQPLLWPVQPREMVRH